MTRDEIKMLAMEVGAFFDVTKFGRTDGVLFTPNELERFAALVAAAEREACAKVCDAASEPRKGYGQTDEQWAASTLAERIRARSNI